MRAREMHGTNSINNAGPVAVGALFWLCKDMELQWSVCGWLLTTIHQGDKTTNSPQAPTMVACILSSSRLAKTRMWISYIIYCKRIPHSSIGNGRNQLSYLYGSSSYNTVYTKLLSSLDFFARRAAAFGAWRFCALASSAL